MTASRSQSQIGTDRSLSQREVRQGTIRRTTTDRFTIRDGNKIGVIYDAPPMPRQWTIMNEYWATQLKLWEAQQAWENMAWENMQACPWLFYPIIMPPDTEEPNGLRNY